MGGQWVPRGDVLRCIIDDGGPNGEVTIGGGKIAQFHTFTPNARSVILNFLCIQSRRYLFVRIVVRRSRLSEFPDGALSPYPSFSGEEFF